MLADVIPANTVLQIWGVFVFSSPFLCINHLLAMALSLRDIPTVYAIMLSKTWIRTRVSFWVSMLVVSLLELPGHYFPLIRIIVVYVIIIFWSIYLMLLMCLSINVKQERLIDMKRGTPIIMFWIMVTQRPRY